jgi:hypothetical protein
MYAVIRKATLAPTVFLSAEDRARTLREGFEISEGDVIVHKMADQAEPASAR